MDFLQEIEPLKQTALAELRGALDLAALEQARVKYLGSHGRFTALMKQLGSLPKEQKPGAGKTINAVKIALEAALAERRSELELQIALPGEPTDFTLPGRRRPLGKLHPLTQVTEDIIRSFRKIGFAVADGPEVEDEYHCFDALNTPADHPARDTQDTFYLQNSESRIPNAQSGSQLSTVKPQLLLRTHTSSVQIRVMEKQQPPVRIIVPGRAYRRDNADATHNPTFLAGCGMVHPQVFENVGYDPEVWTGWAFGFGIERIAMIRYGITDIRLFYESNLRFLSQF